MAEKGHGAKTALVAGVVGAGAIWASTMLGSKVPALGASPYILPGVLLLGGLMAASKGKPTLGAALAATGGVILGMSKLPMTGGGSTASGFERSSRGDAGMRMPAPSPVGGRFVRPMPRVAPGAGALGIATASPGDAGKLFTEAMMLRD